MYNLHHSSITPSATFLPPPAPTKLCHIPISEKNIWQSPYQLGSLLILRVIITKSIEKNIVSKVFKINCLIPQPVVLC